MRTRNTYPIVNVHARACQTLFFEYGRGVVVDIGQLIVQAPCHNATRPSPSFEIWRNIKWLDDQTSSQCLAPDQKGQAEYRGQETKREDDLPDEAQMSEQQFMVDEASVGSESVPKF
jgi:hypothetical protein